MLITPENKKKLARFKEIKRGYYSLIVVLILIVFSLFAEFFINNKALIVSYQGEYYFPVLGKFYSGETFGLDYSYEADYKELKKISQEKADLNQWQNKYRLKTSSPRKKMVYMKIKWKLFRLIPKLVIFPLLKKNLQ